MKKAPTYDVRNIYVFKHPSARVELTHSCHKLNMTTIAVPSAEYAALAEMCGSEAALCTIARDISRGMKLPPQGTNWSDALRSAIKRAAEKELRARQAYAAELNAATAAGY